MAKPIIKVKIECPSCGYERSILRGRVEKKWLAEKKSERCVSCDAELDVPLILVNPKETSEESPAPNPE